MIFSVFCRCSLQTLGLNVWFKATHCHMLWDFNLQHNFLPTIRLLTPPSGKTAPVYFDSSSELIHSAVIQSQFI